MTTERLPRFEAEYAARIARIMQVPKWLESMLENQRKMEEQTARMTRVPKWLERYREIEEQVARFQKLHSPPQQASGPGQVEIMQFYPDPEPPPYGGDGIKRPPGFGRWSPGM